LLCIWSWEKEALSLFLVSLRKSPGEEFDWPGEAHTCLYPKQLTGAKRKVPLELARPGSHAAPSISTGQGWEEFPKNSTFKKGDNKCPPHLLSQGWGEYNTCYYH
jgi:hypothetical protein